jgi:hypothetical protein
MMNSNLDRFKSDIEKLVTNGNLLLDAMLAETYPEEIKKMSQEREHVPRAVESSGRRLG